MKTFIMPLRLFFPAAVFLLIASLAAAAAETEKTPVKKAGEPRLLYTIINGKSHDQMAWHEDIAKSEAGHLQGPGAVLALTGDLRLFADTLNRRLVLRRADTGRVLKVFDLPSSSEVGLRYAPLITDLAGAGGDSVYAADESNMAIWKINLGKNWIGPAMKVEKLIKLEGKVSQLGRISADGSGVIYAADLPRQCTVSIDPDGAVKFVYQGLTNGVPGRDGKLYHPIYYGNSAVRDLEIYDGAGRMVGSLGRLDFDRPVCYIVPVGFDAGGTLYIYADSERKGPVMARVSGKDKKQTFNELKPLSGPGFGPAPYWTGRPGSIEWAEYGGGSVKIYRLEL
ncbi:MAG: hypothetical protein A2008_05845 [Candidatus Wallbacteria bacterium GWC2_49_35]|uniref:SMP-30/Gluconolactonase/LRE-like region domain-containing protein n=1 Tax=Candidatus Wallbacteria bacterium GWC2_49_35 TaxID=1817813 RepID=A0A1F7WFM2_9BACT|nr:MAG: hypothetical protein A2008_05845 [Candidatus Wallbacteria bacterium GWC2_49_35]HBC73729.1 hypothetical protein [Candidatus Wallbacteria bacterium]